MIREQDNVATALRDIEPKEAVTVGIGTKSKRILIQEHIGQGEIFSKSGLPCVRLERGGRS
jgi:hypothetical protein